jgi:hypothetical protein
MRKLFIAALVSVMAIQSTQLMAGITLKENGFEKIETVTPTQLRSIQASAEAEKKGAKDKANLSDWKLVDKNVDEKSGKLVTKKTGRLIIDTTYTTYNINTGINLSYLTYWNNYPINLNYYYPPNLNYYTWYNYQPIVWYYNQVNWVQPSYWYVWQPQTWNYVYNYYSLPQYVAYNPLPVYQVLF